MTITLDQGIAIVIGALIAGLISLVIAGQNRRLSEGDRLKVKSELDNLKAQNAEIEAHVEQIRADAAAAKLRLETERRISEDELTRAILEQVQEPPRSIAITAAAGPANLYSVGTVITDPHRFYGRSRSLAHALVWIKGSSCVSVLGARRTGKTSFVRQAFGHTRSGERHLPPNFLTVEINAQSIAFRMPEGFWHHLLQRLNHSYECATGMQLCPESLPPVVTFEVVRPVVERLVSKGWKVVFAVDEFETLVAPDEFPAAFWSNMRSLAQVRSVSWLTCSYQRLFPLLEPIPDMAGSNFANLFTQTEYMDTLDVASARACVTEPLAATDFAVPNTSVETILKLSGRLPFAIQTAASLRQELLEGGCSEQKALERLEGEFRERMRERFSRYWEHFTPAEQAELARRARARDRFLPVDEKDEAERSLKLYGFLQPQAASTELYEISGDVFRDWIRTQA